MDTPNHPQGDIRKPQRSRAIFHLDKHTQSEHEPLFERRHRRKPNLLGEDSWHGGEHGNLCRCSISSKGFGPCSRMESVTSNLVRKEETRMRNVIEPRVKPIQVVTAVLIVFSLAFWLVSNLTRSDSNSDAPNTNASSEQPNGEALPRSEDSTFDRFGRNTRVTQSSQEQARRERWKEAFPWKPTTDPEVEITEALFHLHESGKQHPIFANHGFLKGFFENEVRLTPQFEKLQAILARHERGENPVVAGEIFQMLWRYHEAKEHPPTEVVMTQPNPWTPLKALMNQLTDKPITWGEETESFKNGILYNLAAQRVWPDREALSEAEGHQILEEILSEIQGMETLENPRFTYFQDYENELSLGDSPLVPYVGWQAAYDRWEEEQAQFRPSSQPHFQSIGSDNQLLDQHGAPIIPSGDRRIEAVLVTPDGTQVPLNQGEHGELMLPTPAQIDEMNRFMNNRGFTPNSEEE